MRVMFALIVTLLAAGPVLADDRAQSIYAPQTGDGAVSAGRIQLAWVGINASTMKGRIISASGKGVAGVKITMADAGGMMLDLTQTDGSGHFELDLSVLDNANRAQVAKLRLVLKRAGKSKTVKVSDVMKSFADTVDLKSIRFP